MGEIIGKYADRNLIAADVKATRTNAHAKSQPVGGAQGGPALAADPRWVSFADERLGRREAIWDTQSARLVAAKTHTQKARALLGAIDLQTDLFVVELREALWRDAGRPGPNADPDLELLFPEGSEGYTAGAEGGGDRLTYLADLLRTVGHPKIDAARTLAAADELDHLARLHTDAEIALARAAGRENLLDKSLTVIARSARLALVQLKKAYLLAGFSEADVHAVIPDRPSAPAKKRETEPVAPPVG